MTHSCTTTLACTALPHSRRWAITLLFTLATLLSPPTAWANKPQADTSKVQKQAKQQPHTITKQTLLACLGGQVEWSTSGNKTGKGVLVALTDKTVDLHKHDGTLLSIPQHHLVSLKLIKEPPVSQRELLYLLAKRVWIKLRNGDVHRGKLLAYDAHTVTLAKSDAQVQSLARGQLKELKTQTQRRHYGVNLSLFPGVMLDIDRGLFRGYVSGAIALPAALDGKLWGFSTGLGVGLPVLPNSKTFKLDVMANVNLMGVASACTVCDYPTAHIFGFGIAVGFHDTLSNGFTYGITIPIMGYSVAPNYVGTNNAHVGHYFLSSTVAMPLGFIGYRL